MENNKRDKLDPMAQAFMKFCEDELSVTFIDCESSQEIKKPNKDKIDVRK